MCWPYPGAAQSSGGPGESVCSGLVIVSAPVPVSTLANMHLFRSMLLLVGHVMLQPWLGIKADNGSLDDVSPILGLFPHSERGGTLPLAHRLYSIIINGKWWR